MSLKKLSLILLFVGFLASCNKNEGLKSLSNGGQKPTKLIDKFSYITAFNMAKSIDMKDTFKMNPEYVSMAINDYIKDGKNRFSDEEMNQFNQEFQKVMEARMKKKEEVESKKADSLGNVFKVEGAKFLSQNKTKPGVVSLPSGVQYQIIKTGTGKKPAENELAQCNLIGTLLNGTEFENSIKRNQPIQIPVGSVFAGLKEALQLMPAGSKWKIWIPSELGLGAMKRGAIPGNSVLIFDLELISSGPMPAGAPGGPGGTPPPPPRPH